MFALTLCVLELLMKVIFERLVHRLFHRKLGIEGDRRRLLSRIWMSWIFWVRFGLDQGNLDKSP